MVRTSGKQEEEGFQSKAVMAGPVSGTLLGFEGHGMVRVSQASEEFILLRHRFYSRIGSLAPHCSLVDVHRISDSTPTVRARWEAFRHCLKTTAQRNGGDANDRFAFCEASKDRIIRIVDNGFDVSAVPEDGGYFGIGLYLTPENVSINSVMSSAADGDGLRHVLMCRAILGKTEEVVRGSGQSQPSSKCFDSAVDDQKSPSRYVIWYPEMNIRVLPLYVLSFKVDFHGRGLHRESMSRPTSPWISIRKLISGLSKSLPRSKVCQIKKFHCEFMERKISRQQLVFGIRQIAGDEILLVEIKSFQAKLAVAARLASTRRVQRTPIPPSLN